MGTKGFGAACAIALAMCHCGPRGMQSTSETKTVFDDDDRILLTEVEGPTAAVGVLQLDEDGLCSGSLVWPNIVLTNAHCVYKEDGSDRETITFHHRFGMVDDAKAYSVTQVLAGTSDPHEERNGDWALLVLEESATGYYFGVKPPERLSGDVIGLEVNLTGYSGDLIESERKGSGHFGCHIVGEDNGTLQHDCDMTAGSSGSPIWFEAEDGKAYVVAVNSAERPCPETGERCENGTPYELDLANSSVSAEQFSAALVELREQHPIEE